MELSRKNHLLFTVANIINPGHYVVLNLDRKHQFKILSMEKALSEEIEIYDRRESCDLNPQTYVTIEDTKKERNFKRGIIIRKIDKCVYEVFLMDCGQFVNVERSKIRKIVKKDIVEVQSLVFSVILYGIIPTKYSDSEKRRRVSQEWCQEAEVFVRKLFTTSHEVKVKKIHVKAGIIYGDILFRLNVNSTFVSLSKMLWEHEFCVCSAAYFKDKVLNVTCEESTGEMKILEALNVPFHCVDNEMIMSSVIEIPKGEGKRFFSNFQPLKMSIAVNMDETSGAGKRKFIYSSLAKKLTRRNSQNKNLTDTIVFVFQFCKCKTLETCTREKNVRNHGTPDFWSSTSTSALSNIKKSEKCGFGISTKKPLGRGQKIISTAKKNLKESPFGGSIRLSSYNKSKIKTNNEAAEEVSNIQKKVFPQNKLKCVWSEVYGSPLVLFTDSVVKPVDSFIEMPILPSVINNLQRKGEFSRVNPLQRWAIPSICMNHNVVMIGGSRTGKTLSYIIAVADFVQDDNYFIGLTDGNGPFVVILCSGIQTGRFIYNMCQSLVGNNGKNETVNSKIKIVLVHGGDTEEQIRVKLTNGCHVLISTPHCLARLLLMPVLTNFERLKCLILDEVDVLTKGPFKSPISNVLKIVNLSTRNRPCQKIFCGKKWTPQVKTLVDSNLKSYVTIIASYLEVAIYAKLKPSIYVIDKRSKLDVVLEKIANRIGKFKILVVCEREYEAVHIYDSMRNKGINSLIACENLMPYDLAEVRSKWSCHPPFPVLIATDGTLVDLNIKDVQILIHFTIPCKSKTIFFTRYSTFLETIFGNHHFQGLKETIDYTDIVLLEYDHVRQFPHIVEYVLRLEGTVTPKALEMYDLIRRRIELDKINSRICRTLLSFGSCEKWENGENCSYRHAFETSRDSSKNVFTDGWVTFVIVKVSDISSFSARLLTHIQPNGNIVQISEQSLQISEQLNKYYGFKHNRKLLELPKIGDVCSIKLKAEERELFYRAEILEITKFDEYNNPEAVNVRLLDRGDIFETKNTGLYYLPDDLAMCPPLTVEVKVVGLRPWDYDKIWGDLAVKFAKNILTKKLEPNEYWSGKIALTLSNTLYLKSVTLKEFLPNIKCDIVKIVYEDKVLKSRMAVKNNEHLPKLLELFSKGSIEQLKEKEKIEEKLASKVVKPKWALVENHFTRVKFSSAENLRTIFLQQKTFVDSLIDVELACEEEAANRMRKAEMGLTESINCLELCPGMYCLALFEERWNRGRVESVEDEDYLIFFVDHGDFASLHKSYVIPISENLLQQLPFQAIECSLVGIKEKKEFSKKILDEIYNFSDDGEKDLYAYIISKDFEPEVTGGQKYIINLLNLNGVSLNKFLAEKEIVEVLDSEKQYLEDIEIDILEQEERLQVKYLEKDIYEVNVKGSFEMNEKSFDMTNLERYLEDVSDDEDAHSFFEEFAFRYLGMSRVLSEKSEITNPDGINETSKNLPNSPHVQSKNETENLHSEHSIKGAEKKDTISYRLRQSPISSSCLEEKLKIYNRKNILTPKILWFQANGEIKLKIILDNLENYSLHCTMTNILFKCFFRERIYVIDLRLFGVVNPSMTTITIQTFQVVLKLQKLSFARWPKLHKDEIKYGWINADVESLQDSNVVEPSIRIRSDNEGDKGKRKKGLSKNVLHSFTDSENSESENTDIFNESDIDSN